MAYRSLKERSKALQNHRRVQTNINQGNESALQKVLEYGINNIRSEYERAQEIDNEQKRTEDYVTTFHNTHKNLPEIRILNSKKQSTLIKEGDDPKFYAHPEEISDFNGLVPKPFKYLGPGNSLDRGIPYNDIDEDAKEHDIAYDSAKTQEEIQRSDIHLLRKASDHIIEGISGRGSISDTIGGTLAGLGIGAKKLVEDKVGVKYPPNLPPQTTKLTPIRTHLEPVQSTTPTNRMEVDNEAGPSRRRVNTDRLSTGTVPAKQSKVVSSSGLPATDGDQPSDIQAEMGLTGTGREQASGGASSDGAPKYVIEKPFSSFEGRVNTYQKVHKFMTFGIASTAIQPVATSPSVWLTTYLAEIPWHIPALFLNQSEFNLISPGSHVVEVDIEVYYRGSVIQFETGATATQLATLNQINDIAVAHALNKSGQGSNVNFRSFNATQPMIPTSITRPMYGPVVGAYRGMVRDYYGSNNTDPTFNGDIPKHQVGRQTFLYNYFALSNQGVATPPQANLNSTGGWPNLAEKITQMDGKTVVNTCVLKSTYHPRSGPIKAPLRTIGHGLPITNNNVALLVPMNGNFTHMRNSSQSDAAGPTPSDGLQLTMTSTNQNPSNQVSLQPTFDIYTPIEKSQFTRSGPWGQADPHVQPSIHIGVQPVPAVSTSAILAEDNQFNSWTNSRAYWEVVATMKVKERSPTDYPYAAAANVPIGEQVVFAPAAGRPAVNTNPRDDGATFAGLYTTSNAGLPTTV